MLEVIEGDLFDPANRFDAIAHGVNLEGVMGSGIAVEFRKRFPDMYYTYRKHCLAGRINPGRVWSHYDAKTDWTIFNCATQVRQGANADYTLVAMAAFDMLRIAKIHKIKRVGLPIIGCGIGGLEWGRVQYILENTVGLDDEVTFVVVKKTA
jgi:O-acetyl-ADP-ribose deacetylase (regulator of RNase III)